MPKEVEKGKSPQDYIHHTFLLLRKYLSGWDDLIEGYGKRTFPSHYVKAQEGLKFPGSQRKVNIRLFENHPFLGFILDYPDYPDNGYRIGRTDRVGKRTNERHENFWSQYFFNQFILELYFEEAKADFYGPAKLNKDTIPNIKWLLESRSKFTGYSYHFDLAIKHVSDNSFPEHLDREGKLARLKAIFQEFKDDNAKSKLNVEQRRSYARRFLDILQSLAKE